MKNRALILGVNNYKYISDLRGCVNDCLNMKKLLIEEFSFEEGDVVVLTDDAVVKEKIQKEFLKMAKESEPGDKLVLHFSGHGSYMPSQNDDEPIDEILCLYDMQFSDPSSYFIDDDLGEMLAEVPEGVHLSVVMDCCHSGTNWKMVKPDFGPVGSINAKNPLVVGDETKPDKVILSRHVPFPGGVVLPEREVRKVGRSVEELEHQFFAGAADVETAADAPIDGTFHGAFTYYFCQSIRELGTGALASDVHDKTTDLLDFHRYHQTPQLEGPFVDDPIFAGGTRNSVEYWEDDDFGAEELDPCNCNDTSSRHDLATSRGQTDLSRLLSLAEKFVDLCHVVAEQSNEKVATSSARSAGDAWVTVHGISRHTPGYSMRWYSSLRPHLNESYEPVEVLWSHHVNPRSFVVDDEQEAAMQQAREEIQREIEERQRTAAGGTEQIQIERFALDDFTRYMFSKGTREKIIGEFTRKVEPLLRSGRRIHIVSHSWGTVVAYEGLRRLERKGYSGIVENFFTVGSALSIGAVRANLFGRVGNGRKPNNVAEWYNIDAKGDFVGGRLRGRFGITEEYLKLHPTGCKKRLFGYNLSCAHGSYFNAKNEAVNKGIFAKHMNE